MINIILASHGSLAEGMADSVSMLYGKPECFHSVCLRAEDIAEVFGERIESLLDSNLDNIIITDILGGTPFNQGMLLSEKYTNVRVVAGMNLGMILELLMQREVLNFSECVDHIVNVGKDSVIAPSLDTLEEDDMDDLM